MKKIVLIALTLIILYAFTSCAGKTAEQPDSGNAAPRNETASELPPEDNSEAETSDNTDSPDDFAEVNNTNDEHIIKKDGFIFEYSGTTIYMGENTGRVLGELGKEIDFYEVQSCSFDGMAKTYYYGGFEISTYMRNKNDYDRVYSVTLYDDSVTTAEDIYIGQTTDDITAVYGADYEEIPGQRRYFKGGTILSFSLEDNIIISITYSIADMYE